MRMKDNKSIFRGNANLKASNVTLEFSKDKVEELTKCYNDPVYFIKNYVKIVHIDKGLVPFELYPYQEEMVRIILGNRHVIMSIPRQSGKSTVTAACVLWYLLFEQYKTVVILANKGATAREILGRVQNMYMGLPQWMQPGVTNWNKGSFSLANENNCIAASTSSSAIRGTSVSWAILDEFAHVPANQAAEFFESVYPTISSGKESKITMFSTPKGLNHFHKFWDDAVKGKSEFVPFSIKWNDVPGRDEKWKEKQIGILGMDGWLQEFEAQFLAAAGTLITPSKLKTLTAKTPLHVKGNLKVFEEPLKSHIYFSTVDVAHGGGGDFSIIQVIDVTEKPYKQVAVYASNNIDYVRFEDVIVNVCKTYNAKCLVETNDLGEPVVRDLFENLEFDDLLTCDGKNLNIISPKNKQFGLRTTPKTKRIGCSNLKLLIENDSLILNDENTIKELSLFTYQGGTYKAEEGFHDDLVMGLVLFACAAQCDNFGDFSSTGYEWKKELHLQQEEIPFGFYDDGINDDLQLNETPVF